MNDTMMLILNTISILTIILTTSYLSSVIDKKQIRLFKALFDRFMGDNTVWEHTMRYKGYLWLYILIPSMLTIAVVLISQLGVGNLKIRLDIQFFLQTFFFISLALSLKGIIGRDKI